MTTSSTVVTAALLVLLAVAPAAGQRPWVEAQGPNVTVISDAGAGRARDLAWQFEQVREAMRRIFPWLRLASPRPYLVLAARNEATMRLLAPGYFERPSDTILVGITATGLDRAYLALRADIRNDDREGVNPFETAYWGFASQAMRDTSSLWPQWLLRGMSSVVGNTLVREDEIQLGRVIERYLVFLRSRPRIPLSEVVSLVSGQDSRFKQDEFMRTHDAHAWALVHFLVWANQGAYQGALNAYITGLLRGADPVKSLTATLGDVARFETAFNIYINRDLFPFTRFQTEARLRRDGFPAREATPVEALLRRAAHHVAMHRPAEARALLAEAQTLQPGVGDEVVALLADFEFRRDDARAALERAATQPYISWYTPFRLATLEPWQGPRSFQRKKALLEQATALNPNADGAWSYLGEVLAALDDASGARAAVARALDLMPASSEHRLAAARTYRRLRLTKEALQAAGLARAMATTPQEIAEAQDVLAGLAREMNAPALADHDPAAAPVAAAEGPAPAVMAVGAADGVGSAPGGRDIATLINDCFESPPACKAVLPPVVEDCAAARTVTSTAACRSAGYILDAGLGMPANPRLAADYYLQGCNRQDELSCVRLATLRALGRGVARDVKSALAVLEPSCASGTQEACYRLGLHLASTGVAADRARARQVLTASCQADFPESCEAVKKLPPGP